MKTYLKFKEDISGYNDVLETVKTVEKIAASSIHNLKLKVQTLQMFKDSLETTLHRISMFEVKNTHPLLASAENGNKALVVIGGNKGLVGGLHHNLANACVEYVGDYEYLIVIGEKIASFVAEEGLKMEKVFPHTGDLPSPGDIATWTSYLFGFFKEKNLEGIDIIYPSFVSLGEQTPKTVAFLPFRFRKHTSGEEPEMTAMDEPYGIPIFEPAKQETFDWLLEQYIGVYFYEIVLEAKLSELSARTVSMEHATEKTKEFIKKIRLGYLKERRKTVTQKQLESFIVHKIA
jgi:F-type H+-transporting ATPase subunit gamma